MSTKNDSPHADKWATKPDDVPPGAVADPTDQLKEIGRYRIDKILGEGGFGRVYLAYDDQLNRPVAIKVPNPDRILGPDDAKAYLTEARVLASLDHPNIVPVYDVGTTPNGLIYVVSKLIEGSDLAKEDWPRPAGPHSGYRNYCYGRRGPALCPSKRTGPPGHQTGQHTYRHQRQIICGRFRPGLE